MTDMRVTAPALSWLGRALVALQPMRAPLEALRAEAAELIRPHPGALAGAEADAGTLERADAATVADVALRHAEALERHAEALRRVARQARRA
jgi:hypothetical protein